MPTPREEPECERREDQQGAWAWVRRNFTLAAIIAVGAALMGFMSWRDGTRDDIKAGAKASVKIEAVEKDYVSKREMENFSTAIHMRINKTDEKIDSLKNIILMRLPDK